MIIKIDISELSTPLAEHALLLLLVLDSVVDGAVEGADRRPPALPQLDLFVHLPRAVGVVRFRRLSGLQGALQGLELRHSGLHSRVLGHWQRPVAIRPIAQYGGSPIHDISICGHELLVDHLHWWVVRLLGLGSLPIVIDIHSVFK